MQKKIEKAAFRLPASFTLNSANLKAAAAFFMFLDHIACGTLRTVLDEQLPPCSLEQLWFLLRLAGRISFPIFCFFLVEGFFLTGNRRKYFLRLFLFAFLSEIPFNLSMNGTVFFPYHQNVLFTMALGLLLLGICEKIKRRIPDPFEQSVFCLTSGFFSGILASVLYFDYKLPGVFLITVLYLFRDNRVKQCILGSASFIWEPSSIFGFLLVTRYNGQRGKQGKYFFYCFYPCHLLLIYLLSLAISSV